MNHFTSPLPRPSVLSKYLFETEFEPGKYPVDFTILFLVNKF